MDEFIYLDNAATSFPKPDIVHDTVRGFYSKYGVNPGRSGCDLGLSAEQMMSMAVAQADAAARADISVYAVYLEQDEFSEDAVAAHLYEPS